MNLLNTAREQQISERVFTPSQVTCAVKQETFSLYHEYKGEFGGKYE